MNTPNIFLFSYMDSFYFYDLNIDRIARVSNQLNDQLMSQQKSGCIIDSPEANKLRDAGFLSSNRVEKVITPGSYFIKDILDSKLHKLTLQVTQQCNFRCDYCIYSGHYENRIHSNKSMDWSMAKKGIDFYYDHSRDANSIMISFYGGEPLLKYELIMQSIEYANQIFEGKDLTYTITTNGSLLTTEMVRVFIDNNVRVSISLDGPPEIHDKSRKFSSNGKGTFEVIRNNINKIIEDIPEFKEKLQFSMVIDAQNSLSCLNEFVINDQMFDGSLLLPSAITNISRKEKLYSNDEFTAEWEYIKFLYFLYLFSRVPEKFSGLYRMAAGSLHNFLKCQNRPIRLLNKVEHHSGPCIPGQLRLFMTADGNFFPCERVSEQSDTFVIGNVTEGFNMDKVLNLLNIGDLTSDDCKKCFAFRHCTICANMAYSDNNLSQSTKAAACKNSKYQFYQILQDVCVLQKFGYRFERLVEVPS
jgi:uncharacterized protein